MPLTINNLVITTWSRFDMYNYRKMNKIDAVELIEAVRKDEFEDAEIEVKRAQRGLPQRLFEPLSAFANQPGGGIILLGIDESQEFRLTGVEAMQTVLSELTDLAAKMIPPLALEITSVDIEDKPHHLAP